MDDSSSSSLENEEHDAEMENDQQTKDLSSVGPEDPPNTTTSQKHTHESSSFDTDKDTPPTVNTSLQVVLSHPPLTGWVKFIKNKGKKLCMEASTHSG